MKNSPEDSFFCAENFPEGSKTSQKIEVKRSEDFSQSTSDFSYHYNKSKDKWESSPEEESKKRRLGYSPFDPQLELKNIKNLSSEEQNLSDDNKRKIHAKKLANFKKELANQKEGIAMVIEELRGLVESIPDIVTETLLERVMGLASKYKFTNDQLDFFENAIEEYQEKHAAVEKYRTMYPSDIDLFEVCFGKKPKGEIKIIKGPMTLYFRCFDQKDFVFASSFYKHGGDETKIQSEDFTSANSNLGMALRMVKIKDLLGVVTAENSGKVHNDEESERIRIHEDQHQFNKLFEPCELQEYFFEMMERVVEEGKTPAEAVENLIYSLVKLSRKYMGFDSSARDEILAHYRGGTTTEVIFKQITNSPIYDYMESYKNKIAQIPAAIKEDLQKEVSEVFYQDVSGLPVAIYVQALKIRESDIQPYIDLVFRDEYKTDLKKWLDSIDRLEQKGYTRDKIMNLLSQEPINSWPNLTRRMKSKIEL